MSVRKLWFAWRKGTPTTAVVLSNERNHCSYLSQHYDPGPDVMYGSFHFVTIHLTKTPTHYFLLMVAFTFFLKQRIKVQNILKCLAAVLSLLRVSDAAGVPLCVKTSRWLVLIDTDNKVAGHDPVSSQAAEPVPKSNGLFTSLTGIISCLPLLMSFMCLAVTQTQPVATGLTCKELQATRWGM